MKIKRETILKNTLIQIVLVVCFYGVLYRLTFVEKPSQIEIETSADIFCEGIESKIKHHGKKPNHLSVNYAGQKFDDKGYRNKEPPYFSFSHPYKINDFYPFGEHLSDLNTSEPAKTLLARLTARIGPPNRSEEIGLVAAKFNQRKLNISPMNYEIEAAYFGKKHNWIKVYGAAQQGYKPGIIRVFLHTYSARVGGGWYLFKLARDDAPINPYKLYLGYCSAFRFGHIRDEFSDNDPICISYEIENEAGYELSFKGDERFILNKEAAVAEITRFLDESVICEQNVILD